VTCHWSGSCLQNDDETSACVREFEKDPLWGIQPAVDVWRLVKNDPHLRSTPLSREALPAMLRRALVTAQHMFYRGRPAEWPCLFYAICILKLVSNQLGYTEHWTEACESTAEEMQTSLYHLSHLFQFGTNNVQPLSSNFDIDHYASLVDDNDLAVKHYLKMHHVWESNSMLSRGLPGGPGVYY